MLFLTTSVSYYAVFSRESRKSHEIRLLCSRLPSSCGHSAIRRHAVSLLRYSLRVFCEIRVKLSFCVKQKICVREILYHSHHKGTPISRKITENGRKTPLADKKCQKIGQFSRKLHCDLPSRRMLGTPRGR